MTMPLARFSDTLTVLGYSFTREGPCLIYPMIVDKDLEQMISAIEEREVDSGAIANQMLSVPETNTQDDETRLETLLYRNSRCERHEILEFKESFIRHLSQNCSGKKEIGAGGQARVIKGEFRNKEIAIKIIDQKSNMGASLALREINVTNYLRHPNIVSLLGTSITSFGLCLLYPFVKGKDLKKILYEHDELLTAKQRFKIIREIAEAIHHIHEIPFRESGKVLVHSDIQPANIMIENFDENNPGDTELIAKLIDFGILNEIEVTKNESGQNVTTHITKTMHLIGVKRYVPPEGLAPQQGGNKEINRARDVFAFGMVLMDVLTNEGFDTSKSAAADSAAELVSRINLESKDLTQILKSNFKNHHVEWSGEEKESAVELINIAKKCIDQDKNHRPHMKEIVEEFERESLKTAFLKAQSKTGGTRRVNFDQD